MDMKEGMWDNVDLYNVWIVYIKKVWVVCCF